MSHETHNNRCSNCDASYGSSLTHNPGNHQHGSYTLNGRVTRFFVWCLTCADLMDQEDWSGLAVRAERNRR